MSKKNIVLWCVVFSLCFLGGCRNKGVVESPRNDKQNFEDSNEEEFGEHIDKILSSGVEVDADIDMPELDTKNVSIYEGTQLKIDVEKMSHILLGNSVAQYIDENGQGEEIENLRTYRDENGSEISSIANRWVRFSNVKFAHIRTDFETEITSEEEHNFDFADRKEADLEIRKILDLLDIEVYPKYRCASLDYITLEEKNLEQYAGLEDVEEFQDDIKMLKAIPWSEEYDCYCFTYYGTVDGLKLNSQDRETNNNVVPGSIIRATYSKDGIQNLEISNIYIGEKEVEKKTLCTMNTILNAIDQKYNSVILQGNYKVNSMELEYIADIRDKSEKYTLLPVWRCSISHNYDTQDKNSSKIINIEDNSILFIDATSGTEIYSGGNI